jgi:hypothetical protein
MDALLIRYAQLEASGVVSVCRTVMATPGMEEKVIRCGGLLEVVLPTLIVGRLGVEIWVTIGYSRIGLANSISSKMHSKCLSDKELRTTHQQKIAEAPKYDWDFASEPEPGLGEDESICLAAEHWEAVPKPV